MPATDPLSLDEQLHRLLDLEAAARHIHGWHPTLMPGMLQPADYPRAAIRASAPALPPHDVEKRATGRTVRIDTLGRAAGRTARFVIGEAVLR
ncbi:Scr1 family TA system antitoxin-like transcriptional regulator, partial [Kitasatospora aureofaciens]|uniref:Scr1 family TA system antitoxin-like transcriptional regulator n=1 Tax=Kitasatospora aureofaciens TaxID=1894 RepID=UPI001F47EDBF